MSLFTNDVVVDSITGSVAVSNFPVTQPISGTVTVANPGLTDTQLRATPVPISGMVTAITSSGATATIAQVTVTNAASIVLLAANVNRKKAIVYLPTVGTKLYIGFSATTSITNFTYIFTANNSTLEVTNYTGVISAIATGASDVVNITEIV